MKYVKGDTLYNQVTGGRCTVLAVRVIRDYYRVKYTNGYEAEYPRDVVESCQFTLIPKPGDELYITPGPFLSRENKDKQKEEPMKKKGKEKKNEGYRFRVSSLHAVNVNRIERESLTKENPVAILHSKGEFKVVVHDDLWVKGVWGVESSLSLLFEEAYHKVGGDFRPMNKEDLESFLDLAKRVRYAPYKGRDPREIRVDIPKI